MPAEKSKELSFIFG